MLLPLCAIDTEKSFNHRCWYGMHRDYEIKNVMHILSRERNFYF